jgi:hypothetical protein
MTDNTSESKNCNSKISSESLDLIIGSEAVNYGIVSHHAFDTLISNPKLRLKDIRLILYLIQKISRDNNGYLRITRAVFAERLGFDKTELSRVLKKLKSLGMIFEEKLPNDVYLYILNPEHLGSSVWFKNGSPQTISMADILLRFLPKIKNKDLASKVAEMTTPKVAKRTTSEPKVANFDKGPEPKVAKTATQSCENSNPKLLKQQLSDSEKTQDSTHYDPKIPVSPKSQNTLSSKYPISKIALPPLPPNDTSDLWEGFYSKLSPDKETELRAFFTNMAGPGIGPVSPFLLQPWMNLMRGVVEKYPEWESLFRQGLLLVDQTGCTFRGDECRDPFKFFTQVPIQEIVSDVQDYNYAEATRPKPYEDLTPKTPEEKSQRRDLSELMAGLTQELEEEPAASAPPKEKEIINRNDPVYRATRNMTSYEDMKAELIKRGEWFDPQIADG